MARLKAFFCRQGLARLRRQERLVLNVSNHQPRQDCWSLFTALLHLYRMAMNYMQDMQVQAQVCAHRCHRLNTSLALAICTSSLPLNSKRNPALSSACVFLRAIGKKWFCSSPNHKICQICGPSDGFGITPSMNSCVAHSPRKIYDPRVMCRRITLKVSRKLLTPWPEICDLIVDAKPAKLRRPEGVLMFTISSLLIHLQHVDMNLPTTLSTFTNNQITGFYRICLAEFATREGNRDTVDDLGFILTQELAKRLRKWQLIGALVLALVVVSLFFAKCCSRDVTWQARVRQEGDNVHHPGLALVARLQPNQSRFATQKRF